MSEIKFKDARYYDHITQDQLAIGNVILLRVKAGELPDLKVAADWLADVTENATVISGSKENIAGILKAVEGSKKPIIVVMEGSQLDTAETTHWARENNVLVFIVVRRDKTLPRYIILLPRCAVDLEFNPETGRIERVLTLRNIATMSGWVTDFTKDE